MHQYIGDTNSLGINSSRKTYSTLLNIFQNSRNPTILTAPGTQRCECRNVCSLDFGFLGKFQTNSKIKKLRLIPSDPSIQTHQCIEAPNSSGSPMYWGPLYFGVLDILGTPTYWGTKYIGNKGGGMDWLAGAGFLSWRPYGDDESSRDWTA
jgi:hypothetical protein